MDASNSSSTSFWGYLIRPDRSATTQLEDLCVGLAKIIRELEPGPDAAELTPQRVAAFYRAVGGNYDSLFLTTSDHALSFMYRTLGCFHSLQPTTSPFDTPSIPCFTPTGFARWQTIQLLLCPEDSVPLLQKAVQVYDVPRPDGGYFPKTIPKQCFPEKPDEAMERWHQQVTGALKQEHYLKRIKNSPYQSPHPEPHTPRDSYFAAGSNGRPGRPPRSGSEQEQERLAAYRRRSSVPEIITPLSNGAERGLHWDPATRQHRKARSQSAQRPEHPTRQRSNTASTAPQHHVNRPSNSPFARPHGSVDHSGSRPISAQYQGRRQKPPGGRPKSPSTVDEDTGSEASSEASHSGRRSHNRKSDEDRQGRKNSLWVPSFLKSHKRRHSSDASYRNSVTKAPPLPVRPEYFPPKVRKPQPHQQPSGLQSPYKHHAGVRFNDHIFDKDAASPAPDSLLDPRAPTIRYPDPPSAWPGQQMDNIPIIGQPLTRESSGSSGTDRRLPAGLDRQAQRKSGAPVRIHTVTGVGGRKYANTDPRHNAVERQRAQMRGSLPTPA